MESLCFTPETNTVFKNQLYFNKAKTNQPTKNPSPI